MTFLTPEEVDGSEDPCAGAYAGGGSLGCGHGDRPEGGHSDINRVNLISLSRTITLKENGEKQIIWFLSPADDKGVAFLKIEHDE